MELEIEAHKFMPCSLKTFNINGQSASVDDFERMEDANPLGGYCCGCIHFIPNNSPENIEQCMKTYNITKEEIEKVISELSQVLYVGSCGLCV